MGAEKKTSDKVLYRELSYALQGAFYEIYNVQFSMNNESLASAAIALARLCFWVA